MEAKSRKPASNSTTDQTSLADICKNLKMDPHWARKILRKNKVKIESGRWSWKKGSEALAGATKLLKDTARIATTEGKEKP